MTVSQQYPAAIFKLIEGKEQQSKAEDRFKISFDDLIAREVIGTSSVGLDAYNHGFREGKAEREAKAIEDAVTTVLYLVNEEGMSPEKALSPPITPADIRDRVEDAVRKQLK